MTAASQQHPARNLEALEVGRSTHFSPDVCVLWPIGNVNGLAVKIINLETLVLLNFLPPVFLCIFHDRWHRVV